MSVYELIDKKVIDYAEIVVNLFDHCNMRCAFCPQDHGSTVGASRDEIMSKVEPIVDWINNNQRSTYFKIHIMGGELFQNEWIEKGFLKIYQEFIDEINYRVMLTKKVTFNFVTNLIFTKRYRIREFLFKNNLKISISYDLKGRFTDIQKEQFKDNIEIFEDVIEMVSLVATKQNIQALLYREDPYFDYLYSKFTMDWDSYLPSVKIAEKMMPKESELLAFYKRLVDEYPKCLNVQHFLNGKYENKMTCTRGNSYTILFDNSNPAGCSGSVLLRDGNTKDLGSTKIIENFFEKYNCFECEYYKQCPFTCFIRADYSKMEQDIDGCVFKHTFDHVKNRVR